MSFDHITLDRRDGIAVLTLNRPKRLNAMHQPMLQGKQAGVEHLGRGSIGGARAVWWIAGCRSNPSPARERSH